METWSEIHSDTDLKVGDVIRVWHKAIGAGTYPTALQLAAAEKRIEKKDPRFQVIAYSYPNDAGEYYFKIRIVEPQVQVEEARFIKAGFVSGVVLTAIAAVGIWGASGKIEKRGTAVVQAAGGAVEGAALTLAQWAAMAIVGYVAIKSANIRIGK